MGRIFRIAILGAFLAIFGAILISWYFSYPEKVQVLPEIWWKPGNEKTVDRSIRPFNVTFRKEVIEDLKFRLRNTKRWQPPVTNAGWSYGVGVNYLPKIIDHWLNHYDFAKREEYLNRYPQYIVNIQGLDIHYLHVKAENTKGKRLIPLLLIHGWPGSVVEFYNVIPMLITPQENHDFVFEVIVPSLPGYGFSDTATISGLSHINVAVLMKNLMLRLGFEQFYVQGGDWGAFINNYMSVLFPQHILGMHSNMCYSLRPYSYLKTFLYSFFPSAIVSKEKYHSMYPFSIVFWKKMSQLGYMHVASTKPDSFGIALSDSPAGLAAWILEKLAVGTNFENPKKWEYGLLEKFSLDELLDNIMIYWITNSITTSMRLYKESVNLSSVTLNAITTVISVPTACAQFPNEVVYQPEAILKDYYANLVHLREFDRGGHYIAMEEPRLLADDVWDSIEIMETLRRGKLETDRKPEL